MIDTRNMVKLQSRNEHDTAAQDQYLTFFMDNEEYGIDILSVQEIRGCDATTCIPNSPEYIQGVLNLRGTIVPIVDLRSRFGLAKIAYGDVTVVIVVKAMLDEGEKTIGMVVDAVSDVYSVGQQETNRAPDVGNSYNREYVKGLINVGEKMVVLLDLKKILTFD